MSNLEEKLEQGITAAQAGRKQKARTLLTEAVESRLEAWLWLYQVVNSLEEKSICLENALTLEPENEFAPAERLDPNAPEIGEVRRALKQGNKSAGERR